MNTRVTDSLFKRTWRGLLPVLLAGLLLVGCAVSPTTETWQSPSATEISDWQFTGRVSLSQDGQGWHAGLFWQERADQFQLKISGPMGREAFRLTGDAAGVLLEGADGKQTRADDAENLLLQTTGWSLPVSGLRYWVRGLQVPGIHATESRDLRGRLLELEQSGWLISYTRYHFIAGVGWPAKLRLVREDITVQMVIDEWQPGVITEFGS